MNDPTARLYLVSLLLLPASSVRAENLVQHVSGPGYTAHKPVLLKEQEIRGYTAVKPAATGEGKFYFLIRPRPAAEPSHAYRIDRQAGDNQQMKLVVRLMGMDLEKSQPPRVLTRQFLPSNVEYDMAYLLVLEAEKSAADWDAHLKWTADAYAAVPEKARTAWRKIVASLESAREKHPEHLGILLDLITAYTQMHAHESNTTRGSNLCELIPARIAELEQKAAPLSPDEQHLLRKARAFLYFRMGLYPLVRGEIDAVKDADLLVFRKLLETLGQLDFTRQEPFEITTELAPYEVTVFSNDSKPAAGRQIHDRWYFLPRLKGTAAPVGRVWFSLASQTLGDKPRYFLYGHSGQSRTLLLMYGESEPSMEDVRGRIHELMTNALVLPGKSQTSEWFYYSLGAVAAAFVVCLSVGAALRIRRNRSTGGQS
jgi:hypothetical protein